MKAQELDNIRANAVADGKLTTVETRRAGRTSFQVWADYFRARGGLFFVLCSLCTDSHRFGPASVFFFEREEERSVVVAVS